MKRWFKMLTGSLAVVLFITFSCAAFAAALVKLRTAWLDEHEAFLVWAPKKKGWDKRKGWTSKCSSSHPAWPSSTPFPQGSGYSPEPAPCPA